MPYLMGESITDTVVAFIVFRRFVRPWDKWPAFKYGIIDANGKQLKKPVTSKERDAWTMLDRFVWRLKRVLQKFVGKNQLAHYIATYFLLRDSINMNVKANPDYINLCEDLEVMTYEKQLAMFNLFKQIKIEQIKLESHLIDEHILPSYINKYVDQITELMKTTENFNLVMEDLTEDAPCVAGDVAQAPSILGAPVKRKLKRIKKVRQNG